MLRLVLPKGSLERATLDLFEQADLPVLRSSAVQYLATIDDPRIDEVRILRPQEIPTYLAEGMFDLGITGRDWIEETGADVVSLGELRYSKATTRPIRLVVAVAADAPWSSAADLPSGVRVSTEYLGITKRFFESHGIDAKVRLSYGATEAKIPDIADAVVEITETGSAPRAAGLKIIDTILTSYTELVANRQAYEDPVKRHAMHQIHTLLEGVMEARGKVLLKLNVSDADLDRVIAIVPSLKTPTVSKLFGDGGYAVETVVPKNIINTLIPALKDAGATGILELPITKIVPEPMKRDAIRSDVAGSVSTFSSAEGQGTVTDDDQRTYRFHCTQITGGARSIAVGAAVRFDVVAGLVGTWEATRLRPPGDDAFLCPVCAEVVTGRMGTYEICPRCGWEDDPVQRADSSYTGGANSGSLDDARSAWDVQVAAEAG